MSRSVAAGILTAQAATTYRGCARLTAYKSRAYWTATTRNNKPTALANFDHGTKSTNVLPESVIYSPTRTEPVSAYVYDSKLYVAQDGSATEVEIANAVPMGFTRPSLAENGTTGYIFFVNTYGQFMRAQFSMSTFGGSQSSAFVESSGYAYGGTPYALAHDKVIIFYPKNGGIGVKYYWFNVTWQSHDMPDQFLFPTRFIYNQSNNDKKILLFTAAVQTATHICVYVSNPENGEVLGRRMRTDFSTPANYAYAWSDIFVAVPTDMGTSTGLTSFRITNAGLDAGGNPYLAGQFWRNEEFATNYIYNMKLHSVDGGLTFAYNRASALSILPYRQHLVCSTTKMYAVGANTVCENDIVYPLGLTSLQIPSTKVTGVSGNDKQLQVNIANGDNAYTEANAYIKIGNTVLLEVGYYTSTGETYTNYGIYIITQIQRSIRDGARALSLSLTHDGLFKITNMSQPYYTELEGKSAIMDLLEDKSHVYDAPNMGSTSDLCVIDFWSAEAYTPTNVPYTLAYTPTEVSFGVGTCEPKSISGAHAVCTRIDVSKQAAIHTYPRITGLPFTVRVYYWSRYDAGSANDDVYVWLVLEKEDGTEYQVSGALATTYRHTACTYPTDITGEELYVSYTFTSSTISVKDKIKEIICVFQAANSTTLFPEKVAILPVNTVYSGDEQAAWTQLAPTGYEAPGFGHPYIMFSSKPYTTKNFLLEGWFDYLPGSSPATVAGSKVAWGLVGLAEDGQNYFVLRYNKTKANNQFELVKVVNGVETVLSTSTAFDAYDATIGKHSIMFRHEDGHFKGWLSKSGIYNATPDINYSWTATGNLTDWDIWHVGFYSVKATPTIRIVGFNSSKGSNIGVLPGETDELSSFPASGTILIGDRKYTYAAKVVSTPQHGPYQYKGQESLGQYTNDGHTYGSPGTESYFISISKLWWKTNGTYWNDYNGVILALSNGAGYIISAIDWKAWYKTSTTARVYPHDRAYVYTGANTPRNYGGTASDKAYITSGLTGVKATGAAAYEYSHPTGSRAMIFGTDKIKIYAFSAISGTKDGVISDMIKTIGGRAGVVINFPSNAVTATNDITSTPEEL